MALAAFTTSESNYKAIVLVTISTLFGASCSLCCQISGVK